MDAYTALSQYYSARDEHARFSSNHGKVEFLTTVRYVEKYLRPGMKLLEIGAGTGRYSHYFAQNGYSVDAVELIESNIEKFNSYTVSGERVTIRRGNAVDLDFIGDCEYDIVLLLGPMYHLFTPSDRRAAISEALRVLKCGGVAFCAYCIMDATILQFGFQKDNIRALLECGMVTPDKFVAKSEPKDVFQLYRKEDVDALMSEFKNVTRLHYLGTDMATNYMKETIDAMDDEVFDIYMRYHLSICERPDMVGATHHSLDILRKD